MDYSKIEFKNEKRYLSNMYPCNLRMDAKYKDKFPSFNFDGELYLSSEHLFQSLKSNSVYWHQIIRSIELPTKTKSLSRKMLVKSSKTFDMEGAKTYEIRPDWDDVRIEAMRLCLFLKFSQNQDLKEKLLATGSEHIEERNNWGDKFWGTVDGVGENNLGKLLMALRDELKGT